MTEAKEEAVTEHVVSHTTQPSTTPPDRGYLAWIQCAASFFLWMNSWGLVNTFGVFQTFYAHTLLADRGPSAVAWIGSIQLCLLGLGGIVVGPLVDRGHTRALVLAWHLLELLGLCFLGLCTAYWQVILAQGVCIGLGACCLFATSVNHLLTWFSAHRGLATGIAATGASVGGIAYPLVFEQLWPRIGFAWATSVMALVLLCTAIVPVSTVRSLAQPNKTRIVFDRKILHDQLFLLFSIATFLYFAGMYVPYFYTATLFPDTAVAPYAVPLINAGSFFGRLIPGYASDRLGSLSTTLACMIATSIVALAWLAVTSTPGVIAFSLAFDFVSGAAATLNPIALAALNPAHVCLSLRMGLNLAIFGLGGLVGNPIAGAILETSGKSFGLQVFCGLSVAVAAIFVGLARVRSAAIREGNGAI